MWATIPDIWEVTSMDRRSFMAPAGITNRGMADITILTIGHGAFMCAGIHGMAGVLGSALDRVLFASLSELAGGEEAGGVLHTRDAMAIREATEPHTGPDTERVTGMDPIEVGPQERLLTETEATFTIASKTLTAMFKDHRHKTDRDPMWHRVNATTSTRTETAMCISVRTTAIGRSEKTASGPPPKGRAHRIEHKRRDSPQHEQALARRWNDSTSPVSEAQPEHVNIKGHKDPAAQEHAGGNLYWKCFVLSGFDKTLQS